MESVLINNHFLFEIPSSKKFAVFEAHFHFAREKKINKALIAEVANILIFFPSLSPNLFFSLFHVCKPQIFVFSVEVYPILYVFV